MSPASEPTSPLRWPLRGWLGVEVCFGLAAMSTIALRPQDSATNFAWPIKPDVSAALLGAFYLSSAWVFVLAVTARSWERIRVMMVPAIAFTFAELVATLLHWDKFSVGTTPFAVWFASYLLPPPILTACYLLQRPRAVAQDTIDPLHPLARRAMTVLGTLVAGWAVIAFLWPRVLISTAPWAFTPLTTRALCGWLLALGLMLLLGALDGDRRRLLVISPFFVLLGPAVALQTLRFADQVDWTHPAVFVCAAVLAVSCACGVHIVAAGDFRSFFRTQRAAVTTGPD